MHEAGLPERSKATGVHDKLGSIASNRWATATRLFAIAALALFLPRLLLFANITTTFVAWPWQFDYTEGVNLSATVHLAQGQNIYGPNGPDAFISAPYTPLFYLLTAPFTRLFGPSFGLGRALSLLSTLAVAFLLAYAVRSATSKLLPGLLAGALWLSSSPVIVWGALYTQQTIALMWGFTGLVWAMRHPSGRRLYVAALAFALAFYTKQSAIDEAAAVTLWLIINNWRAGLRFAMWLMVLIGIPFLGANLLLRGGLWEHIFSNQALPWSMQRFQRLVGRLWGEYWPLLGLATLCMLGTAASLLPRIRNTWPMRVEREEGQAGAYSGWSLAVIYFAIAQASVFVRLGREGVNYNHMIDVLLPACLLIGFLMGHLFARVATIPHRRGPTVRNYLATTYGTVLVSAALVTQFFLLADPHTWYAGAWPGQQVDKQMKALSKLVQTTPGDIYSEDTYLALSNNRPILYDDPFMFVNLAAQGRWDDSRLTQLIRDRQFSLIFLQAGSARLTETAQEAFSDDYDLKFPGFVNTYVPKSIALEPARKLSCMLGDGSEAVALEGYSLAAGVAEGGVNAGNVLRLTLYWRALRELGSNYASFVHMIDSEGRVVSGQDNAQTGASQPTTRWAAGETVTDSAALPLPEGLRPGSYRLIAGMYSAGRGALRNLVSSCTATESKYGDAVLLGSVLVK